MTHVTPTVHSFWSFVSWSCGFWLSTERDWRHDSPCSFELGDAIHYRHYYYEDILVGLHMIALEIQP